MPGNTRLEIMHDSADTNSPAIHLKEGEIYFSSRGGPIRIPIETPDGRGLTKGTEFLVRVDPQAKRTEFTMFDGEVELSNDVDSKTVRRSQQGVAIRGQPIEIRNRIEAQNVVQWWIYYPGILDPNELSLTQPDQEELAVSLNAYRAGALLEALQTHPGYPTVPDPTTLGRRIYYAGLLLSVGAVDRAEAQLSQVNSNAPLARALRMMIAAVQYKAVEAETGSAPGSSTPGASEWLALSYAHQATNNLKQALIAARAATTNSPKFGFAWARVGELEFSFGRIRKAREAVDGALELSPHNPQALALLGFLLAAENKTQAAIQSFNQAIAIDPALGNAWLGRGLCKRRSTGLLRFRVSVRETAIESSWLSDIQTGAALEPTRSLARSYLGKAFAEAGLTAEAFKELAVAKQFDPNDPTPWLYSALVKRDENLINASVQDLEQSTALNDNRALYRSRFLLDEDRAVRSSSLANLYQSAGMNEVAAREAARAVSHDYANYSGHQFLSESYDALRDPTRFNLRYETVWFNELLLANLLSPVGGTPLSQHITQQEYSRLFDRNRLGLTTDTSYRSDGQYRELASQFGVINNTSWSLDLDYQHNNGVRPNNQLNRIDWYTTLKQQLTPQDSLLLLAKYEDYHSGDNFQYYHQTNARPHFKFDEQEQPTLAAGWHHEWSPGIRTVFLGSRLINEQQFSDLAVPQITLSEDPSGVVISPIKNQMDVNYRNKLDIASVELNHIHDSKWTTLSVGARYQAGSIMAEDLMNNPQPVSFLVSNSYINVTKESYERVTAYGYLTLKPFEQLRLIGGIAYDQEEFPANFRHPPVTHGEDDHSQVGPKAGFVWAPLTQSTIRGAYSRSLGGVSIDESYRLEQTQIAGFPQTFRTLIPESTPGVGSVSAPAYETLDLALDIKLSSRTYAGIQLERLNSRVRRNIGTLTLQNGVPKATADSISESLDFTERSLAMSVNQLVGDQFTIGARYKLTRAELDDSYPGISEIVIAPQYPMQRATLHQATGFLLFNHSTGFFAQTEVQWYGQQNFGYSGTQPGDDLIQENLYFGYRLRRGRGELRLGLLNLSGQDYRLNPLTTYVELPRERVFEARLRFVF
jgi:tetratricopeptide (TPR) repeat protein